MVGASMGGMIAQIRRPPSRAHPALGIIFSNNRLSAAAGLRRRLLSLISPHPVLLPREVIVENSDTGQSKIIGSPGYQTEEQLRAEANETTSGRTSSGHRRHSPRCWGTGSPNGMT